MSFKNEVLVLVIIDEPNLYKTNNKSRAQTFEVFQENNR